MKQAFLTFFGMMSFTVSFSQVGIGTSGSVDASAKFQIDATNKGFLPPRVNLSGTTDVTTIAAPATGLMVYNLNTGGTSPNNVTPGFYYYDGSKWQRVINQQPDATVEFDKATPTTASVAFTPNIQKSKDYIYVSSVDGSQWTSDGTSYFTYTPPASTPWYLSTGTNDAGSNKTGKIYRSGNIGLGVTNPSVRLDARASSGDGAIGVGSNGSLTASTAGAGALVYSTSDAVLQYSDGSSWNTLTANRKKATIVARMTSSTQTFPSGGVSATDVTGWTEIVDNTGNFNPSTGIFTAPRDGNYTFSFSYNFIGSSVNAGSRVEAQMRCSTSSKDLKAVQGFPAASTTNTEVGSSLSFVVNLTTGETIRPAIYQNTGSDKSLRVASSGNDAGFVNLAITEL
jgi:hypothetical protein